jgi:hypothetical protein
LLWAIWVIVEFIFGWQPFLGAVKGSQGTWWVFFLGAGWYVIRQDAARE